MARIPSPRALQHEPRGEVRWNLRPMLEKRDLIWPPGVPYQGDLKVSYICAETGFPKTEIPKYLKGSVTITTTNLTRWCQFLKCQPGDILVYLPSAPKIRQVYKKGPENPVTSYQEQLAYTDMGDEN
jgi:hypothetical protein